MNTFVTQRADQARHSAMVSARRGPRQAVKRLADTWISLKPPGLVLLGIVPGSVRFDESVLNKPAFDSLFGCDIGEDDRRPLSKWLERPNRWICHLTTTFVDPNNGTVFVGFGSGLLIGNQHVLTAAHALIEPIFDKKKAFERALDAQSVVVIPSLNGRRRGLPPKATDTMPFGWTSGEAFRTSRVFRRAVHLNGSTATEFDYAVIRLAEPIGARRFNSLNGASLGYWGYPTHRGNTRITVKKASQLRGIKVNAAGYPADKCRDKPIGGMLSRAMYDACKSADLGSVPWYSFNRIESAGTDEEKTGTLRMHNDVAAGMSGGPVWLRWGGVRNLVGIVQGCDRKRSEFSTFKGSLATRITASVKRDILEWLK